MVFVVTVVALVVLGVIAVGQVRRNGKRGSTSGFLGGVPRRASRYVGRVELERLVETLARADGRPVAVVGMGGVGKTVLAAELVHHKKIRRRFRDGVAWLAVNPRADVLALQGDLARRLGYRESVFRDAREGRAGLAGLASGHKLLVVLDNVWERAVLDAFPPECQILFTTRSLALAHEVNATAVEVTELELEQALQLLSNWTGRDRAQLERLPAKAICQRLGRLALGVAMAGAMIGRGGDEQRWHDVLARVEAADLERIRADFGEDYPHPTLLAAIELGIDELPDKPTRERYRELAVFNGRGPFPRSAAEALWTPAGLSGPDCGDLLALLEGRSLIQPEGEGRYSLHDLQADVVAHQLGDQGLIDAHAQLLAGYRLAGPADWSSASDDGYLLNNLAYHLVCAGRGDELRDLLTDLRWLDAKLQSTGLVSLLADYAHLTDDPAGQAVERALRLSAPALAHDPAQLPGQIIGRLQNDHDSALVDTLLEKAASWSREPWLCPSAGALIAPYGSLRLTLRHTGYVTAVAVAPDGRRVVSGGDDGTVRVWDLDTGRELHRFEGHTPNLRGLWVSAVAVSSTDHVVSSGGWGGTQCVWELDSGRELRRLEGDAWDDRVWAVAVTPDGRVVSGDDHTMVRVWELDTGRELRRLEGAGVHAGRVTAVAVTPDGRRVLSVGDEGSVSVRDLDTGREVCRFEGHSGQVTALAVAPDGRVVSGGYDATVRVWELYSGRETARWTGDSEITACAACLGRPLALAVGERRGVTYALHLHETRRLPADVNPAT